MRPGVLGSLGQSLEVVLTLSQLCPGSKALLEGGFLLVWPTSLQRINYSSV